MEDRNLDTFRLPKDVLVSREILERTFHVSLHAKRRVLLNTDISLRWQEGKHDVEVNFRRDLNRHYCENRL